jgi:hypothetical protein
MLDFKSERRTLVSVGRTTDKDKEQRTKKMTTKLISPKNVKAGDIVKPCTTNTIHEMLYPELYWGEVIEITRIRRTSRLLVQMPSGIQLPVYLAHSKRIELKAGA